MVKLAKAAKKGKTDQPPPKDDSSDEESSSEEDASSDEQESPPKKAKKERGVSKKNATPAKGAKNKKKLTTEEDEEEDEDSDSREEMPTKKKMLKAKQESEEDEEEMHPTPKKKKTSLKSKDSEQCFEEEQLRKKKKAFAKAKPEVEEEEEEEDEPHTRKKKKKAAKVKESDGQGEEEVLSSKKKKKKAKLEALAKKKAQQDSDEDESEEEAMDTTPPVKKGKPAKEEESSEESSSSEEEESEQEIIKEKLGKRKKGMPEKKPPAKKQKFGKDGFSLYVGNLKHTEDQDELVEALTQFFSTYGLNVTDVRIATTKRFGYVDFASEEELEKALELTGKELLGKEVKLDKALSKEATVENRKERDARTIFIKNLPFSVVDEDLQAVFEDAVEVRIPLNREGASRGIAYIEFKTEADADKALEDNQGADLKGRAMLIDFIGSKSQNVSKRKEPYQSGKESKTVVINNLAYSATEASIQDIFEKASSIRIPQKNGRPKGFAFVDFETVEDAKEALETYNNTEIEGRTVRLEYSQSDKSVFKSGATKTLFVKGLHPKTTETTLRDSFENAVCARVATDRDSGASKGFGFVDFRTEEEAKAAKEAMEDGEIDGSRVTLDYAKPKGESQGGFRGGRGGRFRGGGRGGGGRGGGRGGGGGRGFGGRGGGGGFGGGFRGRHDNTPRGKKIKFGD